MDIEKFVKKKSAETGVEHLTEFTVHQFIKYSNMLKNDDSKLINNSILTGNAFFSDNQSNISFNFHPSFVTLGHHSHDFVEVSYVYNGEIRQKMEYSEEVVLQEGDIIVVDVGGIHQVSVNNQEDILINCLIKKEFFDKIINDFGGNYILRSQKNNSEIKYFQFHTAGDFIIRNHFERCIVEFFNDKKYKHQVIESYVNLIFSELFRKGLVSRDNNKDFPLEKEIIAYLRTYYKDTNLNKTAAHFHLSPNYLSKFLRRKTDKGFLDLLRDIRLNTAKDLLMNTSDTIESIAEEIGYKNSYFFTKIFKDKFHCLPSEIRK